MAVHCRSRRSAFGVASACEGGGDGKNKNPPFVKQDRIAEPVGGHSGSIAPVLGERLAALRGFVGPGVGLRRPRSTAYRRSREREARADWSARGVKPVESGLRIRPLGTKPAAAPASAAGLGWTSPDGYSKDPGDCGRFFDGGDDLQGAATIRAAFDIDGEDPFEQAGPTDAPAADAQERDRPSARVHSAMGAERSRHAALARAAAGRIHDDLATPRRAVARVDWSCGVALKRRKEQARHAAACRAAKDERRAPIRKATIAGAARLSPPRRLSKKRASARQLVCAALQSAKQRRTSNKEEESCLFPSTGGKF
jgi:hypothetical protein